MLDNAVKIEGAMIAFVDLHGRVWEVCRRDDIQDINDLIDTDDAESDASADGQVIGSHLVVLEEKKAAEEDNRDGDDLHSYKQSF